METQNNKLYAVSFFDKPTRYLLATCFKDVTKYYGGQQINSIILVAAIGQEEPNMGQQTISALSTLDVFGDGKETTDISLVENSKSPKESILKLMADEFRSWQSQWDAYDNKTGPKPKSVDEFLDIMYLKFKP